MRKRRVILLAASAFLLFVFANNTSLLHEPSAPEPLLLAHRGLGQDFVRDGLDGTTCTASRMVPSEHAFLENTIPAIDAAFSFGADIVEFDVHPTADGHFVVFHDWTLDCRTEGTGVTREQTLDYLKTLDVGYGYTADGGETFPFRGRGVGLMPTLDEVLASFPGRAFLINIKSNDADEGVALATVLAALPAGRQARLTVYGGERPTAEVRSRVPTVRSMSRPTLQRCLLRYGALGWSGYLPESCTDTIVVVPKNLAPWLWGWPNRLLQRMRAVGTVVFVVNDYRGGPAFTKGINTVADLSKLPPGYSGGIWTDRIDRIGPALAAQSSRR